MYQVRIFRIYRVHNIGDHVLAFNLAQRGRYENTYHENSIIMILPVDRCHSYHCTLCAN